MLSRMLSLLVCFSLLATLNACPGGSDNPASGRGRRIGVDLPKEPDRFDQFTSCLQSQKAFLAELSRMQASVTHPPDLSHAQRGDNDARYGLSSKLEGGKAGLHLEDRYGGPDWTLWCWEEPASSAAALQSRVSAMADGLKLELATAAGLNVTLLARWANGRYLQVSREVLLGGMDYNDDLHDGGCRWRLSGQWLPYRCLPGKDGPFGCVPGDQADGKWHGGNYPAEAVVPALAAYGTHHGILLASGDKGARDLSRVYDMQWAIDKDYKDGELIELSYRYFDGVQDAYTVPHIVSGLPLRDSVIVEPFRLAADAAGERQLAEAQTRLVIKQLGELSRSFWFVPQPPPALPAGCAVALEEWAEDSSQLDESLRKAAGIWGAQLNELLLPDGKLGDCGYGGIGARDIGGTGIAAEALPVLDKLAAQQLPSLQFSDYLHPRQGSEYGRRLAAWMREGEAESSPSAALDPRNPPALAWILRKHVTDLEAVAQVAGYRFPAPPMDSRPQPLAEPRLISELQAQVLLQLALAEQCKQLRPEALVAFSGSPSLAAPVCASVYALDCTGAAPDGVNTRLLSLVLEQVFGTRPWISPGGGAGEASLAELVMATTASTNGYALPGRLASFPGFEAFAANLDGLHHAGGDLGVIYCDPAHANYASNGELPVGVQRRSFVACLPADWNGARYVWIAVQKSPQAVSVSLDNYNVLTVRTAGGDWQRTLPGGIWKIEHPAPEAVREGDAVLIKLDPLRLPGREGEQAS